jgi:hypothetical protein
MYWMEVAVMSHKAGGRKIKGLKLGASRIGSCSARRPSVSCIKKKYFLTEIFKLKTG